ERPLERHRADLLEEHSAAQTALEFSRPKGGALGRLSQLWIAVAAAVFLCAVPAYADFPYGSGPNYSLGPGVTPNDLSGDSNDWKFAATAEPNSPYAT